MEECTAAKDLITAELLQSDDKHNKFIELVLGDARLGGSAAAAAAAAPKEGSIEWQIAEALEACYNSKCCCMNKKHAEGCGCPKTSHINAMHTLFARAFKCMLEDMSAHMAAAGSSNV